MTAVLPIFMHISIFFGVLKMQIKKKLYFLDIWAVQHIFVLRYTWKKYLEKEEEITSTLVFI